MRCATIVLSPALLRCDDVTHAPFGGGLVASGCLRGLKHRINDAIVDLAFAPQLNAHRKRLNLPPAKRVYHKFFLSSEVVAAFPPWFATPSAQWPEAGGGATVLPCALGSGDKGRPPRSSLLRPPLIAFRRVVPFRDWFRRT